MRVTAKPKPSIFQRYQILARVAPFESSSNPILRFFTYTNCYWTDISLTDKLMASRIKIFLPFFSRTMEILISISSFSWYDRRYALEVNLVHRRWIHATVQPHSWILSNIKPDNWLETSSKRWIDQNFIFVQDNDSKYGDNDSNNVTKSVTTDVTNR